MSKSEQKRLKSPPIKGSIPKGDVAARVRRYVARQNNIDIAGYKMSKRRKLCERDLVLFIETYLKTWFPLPHSEDQLKTLKALQEKALTSGSKAIARPRGWGKSQQTKAAALWVALYRHRRYIIPAAATSKQAKKNYQSIIKAMVHNRKLANDWPEICEPISSAYMKPNRARYITVNGQPCFLECSTTKLVLPTVPNVCLDGPELGGTVIECSGILEAARGLQHDTIGTDETESETIRPDFAIVDDFQTKKSAKSSEQCQTRIETIRGDFKHMSGPDTEIAMVINCTVIEKGDAADQLLDRKRHPEFEGERQCMVKRWPFRCKYSDRTLRDSTGKEFEDLWEIYVELRKEGKRSGEGTGTADKFYYERRESMDEGGEVGWIHGFKPKSGEVSTMQSAFNVIADDGEKVFFSECQNQPIEERLTEIKLLPEIVMQRVNNLPMGEVPTESQIITGFIDPNDHALAWMMCGWWNKGGLTGSIIGYGEWGRNGNGEIGNVNRLDKIWDESKPSVEGKELAFWNALTSLEDWLFKPHWVKQGQAVVPALVLTDVGYTLKKGDDTVYRWLGQMAKTGHGNLGYSRGFPASRFKAEKKAEGDRFDTIDYSPSEWWRFDKFKIVENVFGLPHDADFARREMQRALTINIGAPGSIVFNGTSKTQHIVAAQQICSEQLAEYQPSDSSLVSGHYLFNKVVGVRQEMADCLRGCRLGALFKLRTSLGIGGMDTAPAPVPVQPVQPVQDVRRVQQQSQRPGQVQYVDGWSPRR